MILLFVNFILSTYLGLLQHDRNPTIPEHTAGRGINPENLPEVEIVTCEVEVGDVLMTMERLGIDRSPTFPIPSGGV